MDKWPHSGFISQLYERPIFYWANISRIMFENYILWETETSYYPNNQILSIWRKHYYKWDRTDRIRIAWMSEWV